MELTAKERVEEELKELETKFEKLGAFLNSERSANVKGVNRALLYMQCHTMASYITILKARLDNWED